MRREINDFVGRALKSGNSSDIIAKVLTEAGWPRAEIEQAISSYAEFPSPLAAPRPTPRLGAREAFLYLVLFASLYFLVWHLTAMLFLMVNTYVADPLNLDGPRRYVFGTLHWYEWDRRWHVSMLVVAAPVFVVAFLFASRQVDRNPSARHSVVRRWLGYFTMFLATCAITASLAHLLNSLLTGQGSLRFAIKCFVVVGVGGLTMVWLDSKHWRGDAA